MIARVLSVARIHVVSWPLLFAWPLGVLTAAFAIPWVIFALVDTEDRNMTGSVYSILGIALAFYLVAMTQSLPFALGLGVTRRDYFLATLLVALTQIVGFGVLLWGLSAAEQATDGWGVNMVMFGIPAEFTDNRLVQLGTFLAVLALIAAAGLLMGAIQQRWRVTGLYTLGAVVLVLGGLAAILVTWQRWWPEVGHWFTDSPRAVPMVLVPAVLAAVCLGGAWALVRRATA
ncbi:ABC transporter permease [Nocardia farcinica]|uniref:ABC transporter permease n=1 Tax=Nocardia farcinica TaxID=37329 RepID=UPI00245888ED|nr:ABC transporter permease [Nocardia farcinica]